ncbi:MAG: hypothetical protein JWN47_897, partial [Frankiales bacterium]|nr:hypothetical protein [Frankiales bacterium]
SVSSRHASRTSNKSPSASECPVPGVDMGGDRTTEPGDDNGGTSASRTPEPGDDHGGTSATRTPEPGDDHGGGRGSGH